MNFKKIKNKASFLFYPFVWQRVNSLMKQVCSLNKGEYIAFILFWKMGDIILSTRIIHEVKRKNPETKICYITSDTFKFAIKDNPEVDRVITIKMYNDNSFFRILNRPLWFLTRTIIEKSNFFKKEYFLQVYPEYIYDLDNSNRHLIDIFAEKTNIKLSEKSPVFLTNEKNRIYFKKLCEKVRLDRGNYITIGHRASTSEKTWSIEKFEKLGKKILSKNSKIKVVFVGSKNDSFPKDKRFVSIKGEDLGNVAEIVKNSKLFIGLESGLIHLASSFDIPVVGIYSGKTSLKVGAPLSKDFKIITTKTKNMEDLYVEEVYNEIRNNFN